MCKVSFLKNRLPIFNLRDKIMWVKINCVSLRLKWKRPLLSFSRLTSVPRITLSSRCLPDFFFFNYFLWRPLPLPIFLLLQPLLLQKSCDQVSFPVVGTVITNWDGQHQRPKRSELSRIRMAKFKAQKLSRLSENCPCYPETFQVIRKI